MPSRSPSPSGLNEDEDDLLPSPSDLDPTSDLYASYVAAYNAALPSPTSTPTPASIPMRLPRGGAAEAQHRRKLSQLGELDKRFNPPPPSVWSRAALVLGLVGLLVAAVWMRMGVLEGKREGSRAAIKYAKEQGVTEEAVTLSGGIPAKEL
ncbi:hypothetical protein DFP72DRAFT_130948 [Ephemerocybe angulata]|uniref:Uncharacterized protein n=1 Tax=Ephemerocybe angulata TaxID=980116 RepID=A0A8H6HCL2_9AGAR|nr:hypothetical protein DFP72DRAFT_130948 [Tulosesus angulatus]